VIRNRDLEGLYLADLLERGLRDIPQTLKYLTRVRKASDTLASFGIFVLFGLRGLYSVNHEVASIDGMKWLEKTRVRVRKMRLPNKFPEWETNWYRVPIPVRLLDDIYYDALCAMRIVKVEKARITSIHNLDTWYVFLRTFVIYRYGLTKGLLY
jgi:hypothetical protein